MTKCIDKLLLYLPWIVGVIFLSINIWLSVVDKNLPGLDSILESVINFTSIIIGVLIALFGIIVTITDKDVMKKLRKNRDDKVIFKYSLETLVSNFILLIASVIMQSIIKFPNDLFYTQCMINIWIFFIFFSISSSIRTIYYLLLISFNQNDQSSRPNSQYTITEERRDELRKNK
ncbi:hypothetical protein ACWH4J_09070 [Enterococcus faecalis]|nr:hypothetical protein [Enterococcus faecalis]